MLNIKDASHFGGDPADFVRWKKSPEIVISGTGDGIRSEIDKIVDTRAVPTEAESKAKHVKANSKLRSIFYLLINGQATGILYPFQANRGEYTPNYWDYCSHCKDLGNLRGFTVPHTLQQNGSSERDGRSLMGAARCLLNEFRLPRFLQGGMNE